METPSAHPEGALELPLGSHVPCHLEEGHPALASPLLCQASEAVPGQSAHGHNSMILRKQMGQRWAGGPGGDFPATIKTDSWERLSLFAAGGVESVLGPPPCSHVGRAVLRVRPSILKEDQ